MSSRRQMLVGAGTALAGVSGCLTLPTANASSLSLHFERVEASAVGSQRVLRVADSATIDDAFVDRGTTEGATTYGYRAVEDGELLELRGTYYEASVAENGTETVTRPVLRAESVSDPGGEVGDASGLSRADGQALKCAVASSDGTGPEPCVLHAGEESVFWPEPAFSYYEVGGDYYRLSVAEEAVSLTRYDYSLAVVAESQSAFAAYYADRRLAVDYDAMDLSERQKEILRTAASEGVYREEPAYSDAFRELVEAFREGRDAHEDYVRFEGEFYLAYTREVHDD